MTTIAVFPCTRCDLRFAVRAELDDHLQREHDAVAVPIAAELWGQVCVPVDPARGPSPAVRVAAVIARQASMTVELVAVPSPGLTVRETEAHLRSRAAEADRTGAPATETNCLDPGGVAETVLAHVAEGDAIMLCMESRSRGAVAEMALGSVSEAVVRRSPVPVLLVGPHAKTRPEAYSTLVVAVDGSAPSELAVQAAAALAARMGADLFLVQVLDQARIALPDDVAESNYLRRIVSRLPAGRTNYDVLHARNAARAIVDVLRDRPDALLVLGTHGRTGVRRLAMGSVALDIVRHSPTPVLVVSSAAGRPDDPT